MKTKQNKKEDWEERLRAIFFIKGKYEGKFIGFDDWKQFISQELQKVREETIKEVIEEIEMRLSFQEVGLREESDDEKGYKGALQDIIKTLKDKYKI